MTAYVPTEEDVRWFEDMFSSLVDGGLLAFPASMLIYRIDKEHKTLMLQNPEVLEVPYSTAIHCMTIETCKAIGYDVTVIEP